jgi:hypothetical protein
VTRGACGQHSVGGQSVLRPAVVEHLKREGFQFSQARPPPPPPPAPHRAMARSRLAPRRGAACAAAARGRAVSI